MSGECCTALVFILMTLTYLLQTIVAVFVLPIKIECSYDSLIPDSASIGLSMQDWISGGMVAGIAMFAAMGASFKGKTSDCVMVLVALMYILYNIFVFIWSIIGITLYNEYYE